MTKTAYNAWLNDYREALTQAAGIAHILGFSDHAKTLHELSCQAMGIDTTANKRQKDIDTEAKTRYHKSNQAACTPMEKKQEGKKMTIYGRKITADDMCNIADYMRDDIREELHSKLAPCSHEDFLSAYLDRDPDFIDILRREFDFAE